MVTETDAEDWRCTAEERWVLDTVKCWPGIDAAVNWSEEKGWSVQTPPAGIEQRDANLAAAKRQFDEGLTDIYERVAACWKEHGDAILYGRCGYSIFGSRPVHRTPLLIIGLNPGYAAADMDAPPQIQQSWPLHDYLSDDRYKLKDRLENLLDNDRWRNSLAHAASTNFLFFRSRSIRGEHPSWSQVPKELRLQLENFCEQELNAITSLLEPKQILVLGMAAVDKYFTEKQSVLIGKSGGWLLAKGFLGGRPALGIKHPTGAHWSDSDWQETKRWFAGHEPAASFHG